MTTQHIEVKLTRGKIALVSEQDVVLVQSLKWYAQYTSGLWYAVRDERKMLSGRMLYMHSFITAYARTDHRDGNGLNNTRENLREATQMQNVGNTKKISRITTSKYKGVSWCRKSSKWKASIQAQGKRINLGLYEDETYAAIVFDEAARELHDDFAVLNFPDIGERSAITGLVMIGN